MRCVFAILAAGLMLAASFSGCLADLHGGNGGSAKTSEYEWICLGNFISGFRETDRLNQNASKTENLQFTVPADATALRFEVKLELDKDFLEGYLSPVTGAYSVLDALDPTIGFVIGRGSINVTLSDPSGSEVATRGFDNVDPQVIMDGASKMTFPQTYTNLTEIESPAAGEWGLRIEATGVGTYYVKASALVPDVEKDFLALPLDTYLDKIRGSFVGQMAGVTYGAPYEFRSMQIIEGPMNPWIPMEIVSATDQDDLYVEMTFLKSMVDYGISVSQAQAALDFANSEYDLWHANYYGRENLRNGISAPYSGHPNYNEHADDIDFQIEADVFGLICPGLPVPLADFCDRFGHIMNYGDGIYGGLFITSMYCKAFFESDPVALVEYGLSCLPPESYYAHAVSDVLECYYRNCDDWTGAWEAATAWDSWDHCPDHLGIPALVNGAYVALALLYGHGNIWKTMEIATRCGRDADCNPASACGVLGAAMGYDRLPEDMKMCLPLIDDQVFSYTEYTWLTATETMYDVGLKVVESQGGHVDGGIIYIPVQEAPKLELERWDHGLEYYEVPLEFATNYPPGEENPPIQKV